MAVRLLFQTVHSMKLTWQCVFLPNDYVYLIELGGEVSNLLFQLPFYCIMDALQTSKIFTMLFQL